jgi:hypothetical protein
MGSDHKKEKCAAPGVTKTKGTLINNLNFQASSQNAASVRHSCPSTELVKNGGFEETGLAGIFGEYAYWDDTANNIELARYSFPHEGTQSARFKSLETQVPESKTAVISQSVTVPPECFLVLSFADNFEIVGEDFQYLLIRARVFYDSTDLIRIDTWYLSFMDGQGFNFHQKMSDNPVPPNVSSVTVQFTVEIKDTKNTSWLLDSVSLRAI